MERKKFLEVFRENLDGTLSPLQPINVNGILFGPGVAFGPGVNFGGINFHQYKYLDIAVENVGGTLVIKGFFK